MITKTISNISQITLKLMVYQNGVVIYPRSLWNSQDGQGRVFITSCASFMTIRLCLDFIRFFFLTKSATDHIYVPRKVYADRSDGRHDDYNPFIHGVRTVHSFLYVIVMIWGRSGVTIFWIISRSTADLMYARIVYKVMFFSTDHIEIHSGSNSGPLEDGRKVYFLKVYI